MASWKIDISLKQPYTSRMVYQLVGCLRKQQYIRYNSMFNIEINGSDDYTIRISTDYDGVKDAIVDTCERVQTRNIPHNMVVEAC